ncbi:MAG: helix-turn-helix domain-containing protein [Alphaproteobacteria bacterium]|nr:helix-turn-helix domain-containing protein [Alphaproteobacteria bacterium]
MRRFRSGDHRIKAGQDIFSPGARCEAIYSLTGGWAFRYALLEDGRRQILDFVLPGAVLGFHPTDGARATYGVQALTDASVCVIRRSDLVALSRELPEIGFRLAWLVSRDRSLAFDHLASLGRQSAHQRVAHLILELFIRYRAQWPGQRFEEMHLPLTQEHIGDALGLTSVHVNRVLRDLRKKGVLEFHYKRLCIHDPDKLIGIAEIDQNLLQSWMGQPALNGDVGFDLTGQKTSGETATSSKRRTSRTETRNAL